MLSPIDCSPIVPVVATVTPVCVFVPAEAKHLRHIQSHVSVGAISIRFTPVIHNESRALGNQFEIAVFVQSACTGTRLALVWDGPFRAGRDGSFVPVG